MAGLMAEDRFRLILCRVFITIHMHCCAWQNFRRKQLEPRQRIAFRYMAFYMEELRCSTQIR